MKGLGWYVDETPGGQVHCRPLADTHDHVSSVKCRCHPEQDDEFPELWHHNSYDRREDYEIGLRKPH